MDNEIISDKTEEVKEQEQEVLENKPSEQEESSTEETVVESIDATTMDLEEMESKLEAQKEAIFNKNSNKETNDVKESAEDKTLDTDKPGETESETKLNKHLVRIDEKYIAEQPEEHQEILRSILGKKDYTLSDAQLLKNHVHAELTLKNSKAELEKLKSEKQVPEFSKEETDLATQLTNKLVNDELKAKYPDMPDMSDAESFADWKRYLNADDPDKFMDFREDMRSLTSEFRKEAENEVMLKKNWKSMAQLQTETEIGEFSKYVESKGLTLEDLGVNKDDVDFIKSILYKDNRQNPDVIQLYKGEIPVVINGRVLSHLRERYMDKIIELREIKARTDAYTKKQGLTPNPSLNNTNIAGKVTDVNVKSDKNVSHFSGDEDAETMREKLEKQRDALGIGAGTSII